MKLVKGKLYRTRSTNVWYDPTSKAYELGPGELFLYIGNHVMLYEGDIRFESINTNESIVIKHYEEV